MNVIPFFITTTKVSIYIHPILHLKIKTFEFTPKDHFAKFTARTLLFKFQANNMNLIVFV